MRGKCLRAFCLIISLGAIPVASAENKRSAEPPLQVTTCQLETHPNAYDHKLVEVRGRIYFGEIDFFIDATCETHGQARVWLDLRGDVLSSGEYWGVSCFLSKHKGVDVPVKGITIFHLTE